jgi:hypothetical protein
LTRKKSKTSEPKDNWVTKITDRSRPFFWLSMALVLWMMLAVMYPGPVLEGQVFLSSDSSNADAFGQVGDASLAKGHYPLWNPYLFAGMPSFSSFAYPKFIYPPTQIFNFLQQKMGFVPLTWLIGHMLFGGLGMVWLLSRWRLPVAALLLGAAVFLFFPKVVAWGVHGHGSKLGAAMYLPWVVGWMFKVQDAKNWSQQLRAVGMIGLLMGLQFLRGHPQITFYTLATVGWLGLWNTVMPFAKAARSVAPSLRVRALTLVVGGLLIGGLIGSVLLIPAHDYAGISIRGQDTAGGGGVGLDYATGWSLAPDELATLVLPAAAGFGKATYMGLMPFNDYPNYIGFLLLILAAAAWRRGTRLWVAAAGSFAILVVIASFGQGFYAFLYDYLPFFNKFRVPSMILILFAFVVAVLAPRSVTAWQEGEPAFGRSAILPSLLTLIGVIALFAGGTGMAESSFTEQLTAMAGKGGKQAAPALIEQAWLLHKASLVRIGLLCLVAGGAFAFSLKNAGFRRNGLLWTLLILVMIDLGTVDKKIIHPEKSLQAVVSDGRGGGRLATASKLVQNYVPRQESGPGPEAAAIKSVVGHNRIWPLGSYGGQNIWLADEIHSLGGYHPAKLANYEQIRKRLYSERPAGRIAAWLGGSAVIFDQPFSAEQFPALSALGIDLDPTPAVARSLVVYRNKAALPRARLITDWKNVSELPEKDALGPFLDGIASGEIDVRATTYLREAPVPAPKSASNALPVPEFVLDSLDEVVLQVETPVSALLLLADMMAPGWQVTVDGEDKPLLTADLVLRAVAIEAGSHTVRFHYHDPSVRRGLTMTLIGVILMLGLLIIPFVARKSKPLTSGELDSNV